jgi:hypothetical protein
MCCGRKKLFSMVRIMEIGAFSLSLSDDLIVQYRRLGKNVGFGAGFLH